MDRKHIKHDLGTVVINLYYFDRQTKVAVLLQITSHSQVKQDAKNMLKHP